MDLAAARSIQNDETGNEAMNQGAALLVEETPRP